MTIFLKNFQTGLTSLIFDMGNNMITESEFRIHKILNDHCIVYAIPARGSAKLFTALYEYIKLLNSGKRITFVGPRERKENKNEL